MSRNSTISTFCAAGVLFLLGVLWTLNVWAQSPTPAAPQKAPVASVPIKNTRPIYSFTYQLPDFSTAEAAEQADRQTSEAIQRWRGASSPLHRIIETSKASLGTRANVIEFLGGIRSESSVPSLILQINLKDTRPFSRGNSPPARAFEPYPARGALKSIGLPAEKWIFLVLSNNHNWIEGKFIPEQVEGFAEVLVRIEGKKFALLKLQDQQERTSDPVAKEQFQLVKNEVQTYPDEQPRS